MALSELLPTSPPTVLITEVQTINTQRVEFANLSLDPVDLSGWRIQLYDYASWPASKSTLVLPAGTVCPGLGVFQIRGSGSWPGTFPLFGYGVPVLWSSASSFNQIAVLLRDADGRVLDFFCAVDAYPAQIVAPAGIAESQWSGPPVTLNNSAARTYQRTGRGDHQNAADWIRATNSVGAMNPGLLVPFVAAPTQTALTPV